MVTTKRFLTVAVVLVAALSLGLHAQDAPSAPPPVAPGEVGIDEHLGATIPLDLVLKDEDGKPVKLADLIDKPTILTLNFFRCTGICTPLLNGVAEVVNRGQITPGQDYQIVTVSFDDRDTPEIAFGKRTNYIKQITRPIAPGAWHFLTGDAATTKALCDSVGFKFKRQGDQFIHPGAIIFLSPKGMVTRYMYGVTYLPADVQMAVLDATKGATRPTINKWLQFCFSYDPKGRRYVFSATRLGATAVILLAGCFLAYLIVKAPKKGPEGKKESA
jgi:protein SCO1